MICRTPHSFRYVAFLQSKRRKPLYDQLTEEDNTQDADQDHLEDPHGQYIQPELGQLVLAGTHGQSGDAVDGHEPVDPCSGGAGVCQRNGVVAILHAQRNADGAKMNREPKEAPVKVAQIEVAKPNTRTRTIRPGSLPSRPETSSPR